MYIPKAFNISDKQVLADFIKQNSFGILFSQTEEGPFASHLPFLQETSPSEDEYLIGHMAKTNPHWEYANGKEVLVVFPGPHTYISPTWYGEPNTVPTWNYLTVHVRGEFTLVQDDKELEKIIEDSLSFYEGALSDPWDADFTSTFISHLMQAIMGFKIKINKLEGKWKLSQNHSIVRQQNVVTELRKVNEYDSDEIADLMDENIKKALKKGDAKI